MKITSSAFEDNQPIPAKYTCDGDPPSGGTNPPLEFLEVPEDEGSLVLIMEDPDAPGKTFTHWIMWNIPTPTTSISENSVPLGAVEGTNDFNKVGYGGPCPPSGTHRYIFRLIALDAFINLESGASKNELEMAMASHIVVSAELTGLYGKK